MPNIGEPCSQADAAGGRSRRWVGYALAIGLVAAALAISLVARPLLHETAFLLFLLAVLFSASYGGLGPGLLATAAATAAIHFFLLPPRYALLLEPESLVRLAVFALLAFVVSTLTSARKHAGEALTAAYQALEDRVQARTAELARANATLAQRARQQGAASELGQRALAGHDLTRLVHEAVSIVARELQVEHSQVLEQLPDGRLVSRAGSGWSGEPDGFRAAPGSVLDCVLRSADPVVVDDLATDGRFRAPEMFGEPGVVSCAAVLVRGYRPFGVLAVCATHARLFTREDVDYLQAIANVIATAADRSEGESISHGQTAALVSTLNALTSRPDLASYLELTLAEMREQLRASEASLWLYDPEHNTFRPSAVGEDRAPSADARAYARRGSPPAPQPGALWREMLRTRRPLVAEDTATDPRLDDGEWWLAHGVRTLVFVPMLLGEEPFGLFRVECDEPRHYRMEEMDLAQALAQQATLAVQMTHLAEQGQEAALLQERNRMAREIHDSLAQGFTGVIVQVEAAKLVLREQPDQALVHIMNAGSLARESLAEARRSVWALRPQALEEDTLSGALTRLVRQTTFGPFTQAAFHLHGIPRPLPAEVEDNLLRIAQEALTNALRHARSRSIRVDLTYDREGVRLRVRDDGEGFDPLRQADSGGLGLIGMRERADRIGGRLDVVSGPGKGTEVTVSVTAQPGPPLTGGA